MYQVRRHVWNAAEVHILDSCVKVLVLGICARKAEFSLQRNIVCQPSLKTLVNRILRWIDEVIDEFQLVVVSSCLRSGIFPGTPGTDLRFFCSQV